MAGDDRLNPGADGAGRFDQETAQFSGPYSLGEYGEYGSYATSSLVGQDYDRLFAATVFTTAPEVVFTNDGFTEIPFIPVELQSRQQHDVDPLLGADGTVLSTATDSLLGGGQPEVNSVQGDVVIPIDSVPQLVEDVAKKVLAAVQLYPTNVYHLNHSQFGGGFAETVHGNQVGGDITNGGAVSSQSRLFALIEKDLISIISKLPSEYLSQPDTPFSRVNAAAQVIAEIERRPDAKHDLVASLRSLEADGFRQQSADPIINIVLAAFAGRN